MQRKTEKGSLGKVLCCMRMALYNQSVAEMAEQLGISPTYLNAIECEQRPCTFKIIRNIFVNYVLTREIKRIDNPNFLPENVFNCAWNAGLYSTLGLPLSPKQTFDILMAECKNCQKKSSEKEKNVLLKSIKDDISAFEQVPIGFFADKNFVSSMHKSVKSNLIKKANSDIISDSIIKQINTYIVKISKKTISAIKKCGEYNATLNKMLNKLTPVTPQTNYDYYKREA